VKLSERVRQPTKEISPAPGFLPRGIGVEAATRRLLIGGVVPPWLGAGLADWYMHRRTQIERTAGTRESAIHLVMATETGVPILIALFYEVNAGVLLASLGGAALHNVTAFWDQVYAEPRRRVSPLEQHIHSYLEVCPLMAAGILTALHWDQAVALIRGDRNRARFALRAKRREPLPTSTRSKLLAAIAVFGALPPLEELWRCWRVTPTLRPLPKAVEPPTETLRAPPDRGTPLAAGDRTRR
jgi:hypothetical protein